MQYSHSMKLHYRYSLSNDAHLTVGQMNPPIYINVSHLIICNPSSALAQALLTHVIRSLLSGLEEGLKAI
jgi:hypothetical protein